MRRTIRLAVLVATSATIAACASPTAPTSLICSKVPGAGCVNKDYINPAGDYINPAGDYINPAGDAPPDSTPPR
jgi:hypothetical protein